MYVKPPFNQIVYGDMLPILKTWPEQCIDLTVTDPPYNLGKDFGPTYNDSKPGPEYWQQYHDWFSAVHRVSRDPSYLYVSCIPSQLWITRPLLEQIGWTYCQFIVWYAPNIFINSVSSRSRTNQPWTMTFETILVLRKGKQQRMLNSSMEKTFDVISCPRPQSNYIVESRTNHPTQKPLKLISTLIARTPGQVILDPFIGSGTTAIACRRLERQFIGIDINPKFVTLAQKRLKAESSNGNLFRKEKNGTR